MLDRLQQGGNTDFLTRRVCKETLAVRLRSTWGPLATSQDGLSLFLGKATLSSTICKNLVISVALVVPEVLRHLQGPCYFCCPRSSYMQHPLYFSNCTKGTGIRNKVPRLNTHFLQYHLTTHGSNPPDQSSSKELSEVTEMFYDLQSP